MRYEIPIANFEEVIGQGLWVGHHFVCKGQALILTAIGQAETARRRGTGGAGGDRM